jgi:FkbM family methyltransferase
MALHMASSGLASHRITQSDAFNTPESHLQHVFSLLNINCVVDVGAHQGQYGVELRNHGYSGRIVSFEPVAANYEKLRALGESDADWRTYQFALAEENSSCDIHLFAGSTWASFLRTSEFGRRRFLQGLELAGTERVEVRRLDAVFREAVNGLVAPRVFLRVDTQGYDLAVLRGAGGCLRDVIGLQIALTTEPIYSGATNVLDEAVPFVRSRGFSPTAFFPVTRDSDGLAVIEYDAVFCRPTFRRW